MQINRKKCPPRSEEPCAFTHRRPIDILRDPRQNKGQGFTHEEREELKLFGLLPVGYENPELQLKRELHQLRTKKTELEKYLYLMGLLDRNERLFHRLIVENIVECMPLIYTPIVGLACQKYGEIWTQPRGLYISLKDKGRVKQILENWPERDVKVIVFTDGERILGLGDLGVNGMGIPVGKLQLYSACGGISPQQCLPIQIDVGTNNETLLQDEYYMGLKQKRLRGKEYHELIEEFMTAATQTFGRGVLLQFEDFGNQTAFELLERTQDKFTTFNDDIQGTASVTLAGIISSLRLTSQTSKGAKKLSDHKFVFFGAGEAGTGIAQLLAYAIHEESKLPDSEKVLSLDEARRNIWLVDSTGLVTQERAIKGGLAKHKLDFAHEFERPIKELEDVVRRLKPSALIGVSGQGHAFTEGVCRQMAKNCEKPLIFSLSNPTSNSECTAEQAYEWTNGKCIFASGSPFPPYELGGKKFVPGQGNNAYIFPGLGLGVIAAGATKVPDVLFYVAAKALSDQVTEHDLDIGCVYPQLERIREVSFNLAVEVVEAVYRFNLATVLPKPDDLRTLVKKSQASHSVYE